MEEEKPVSQLVAEFAEKDLSRFVAEYPTDQQLNTICLTKPTRRIFFSKTTSSSSRRSSSSSSGSSSFSDDVAAVDDDPWMSTTMRMRRRIHEKIKRAFSLIYAPCLNGVIQFWAPATTPAPTMLSTSHQPFVLDPTLPFLTQYRLFSINSPLQYDDDGPLAYAYHTCFPDVVLPLKDHKGQSPLVDKALDCCFTCLILLPVFYPTRRSSYPRSFSPCVGVVECCVNPYRLLELFQVLIEALNRCGFTTYHVQQHLPNLPTHGLNHAKDEIEDGLKIVCESLHLKLAQVWINDDVVYHVPSSPSSPFEEEEEAACFHHQTNQPRKVVVKLCGFQTDSKKRDKAYSDYYKVCDVLPLKFGDGLAGKTLQTHEPCFCKDLSTFRDHTGFSGLLCRKTKCSGLAICLRSTHTGKSVDYAFEFLWGEKRNPTIVLESLFLTLKMCLPSFTFASGAPLGEELRVIDVSNSTAVCETSSFKILQGNRFSPPKQEGTQREKRLKRKLSHFFRGNVQPDTDSDSDSDDHDYYWILSVVYGGKTHSFFFQSSKLADAKEKIEKCLFLDPGTYTLEFHHAGEKVVLNTDEDLAHCVRNWRASLKRTHYDFEQFRFRLFVRPLPGCCEKSQESPATLG